MITRNSLFNMKFSGGFFSVFFEENGQYQFNNQEHTHHQGFAFSGYFSIGTQLFKISFQPTDFCSNRGFI